MRACAAVGFIELVVCMQLRRISNSTAAGSPDWWQASLATAGRQHSAAGAGGQGAGSGGEGVDDIQPPAGSQADGEPLFACLGRAQPPGAAPRHSAQTPAAPRLSAGFETPKVIPVKRRADARCGKLLNARHRRL